MGVFKEEARAFETISQKSQRIYNDAADYGFPYNTKNPPAEVQRVISIIQELKEADKKDHELPFIRNRQEWGSGVSLDVVFFWEKDEGYYMGTKYSISFNQTPKSPSLINKEMNGFISVDVEPYSEEA